MVDFDSKAAAVAHSRFVGAVGMKSYPDPLSAHTEAAAAQDGRCGRWGLRRRQRSGSVGG